MKKEDRIISTLENLKGLTHEEAVKMYPDSRDAVYDLLLLRDEIERLKEEIQQICYDYNDYSEIQETDYE